GESARKREDLIMVGPDCAARASQPWLQTWHRIRPLGRDRHGGTLVLMALAMPLLVGGLALAIDTAYLYLSKRQLQQQADTAAAGAALAKSKGTTSTTTLRTLAIRDAVRNGYVDAAPNSVAVNIPPASGAHAGSNNAVEVILERPMTSFFARYFNADTT